MTVEIRELVIRTTVVSAPAPESARASAAELKLLKRQILGECRKLVQGRAAKRAFK